MAGQKLKLRWLHRRRWQVPLVLLETVSVVFLLLSVFSPAGLSAGLASSTAGLFVLLVSSATGRRQVTGRW